MPGRVVIQWDKDDCAALGIVKVDLLGLGMMALLQDALEMIRATRRRRSTSPICRQTIPRCTPCCSGPTPSASSRWRAAPRWRRCRACGPSASTTSWSRWRSSARGPSWATWCIPISAAARGARSSTVPHPGLEPILARTLGVPLFQEQLLRMAMATAGFTGGEAEELRRAFGFKRSERAHGGGGGEAARRHGAPGDRGRAGRGHHPLHHRLRALRLPGVRRGRDAGSSTPRPAAG